MHTYLRRALPATLVVLGVGLALLGGVLGASDQALPGALLLVITGAAAQLYAHLNRPRRPVTVVLPGPAPGPWAPPLIPTQRTSSSVPGVPSPRLAPPGWPTFLDEPVAGVPGPRADGSGAGVPGRGLPSAGPGGPHADGALRAGLRHRVVPRGVVPRGALPHQRRATDGS